MAHQAQEVEKTLLLDLLQKLGGGVGTLSRPTDPAVAKLEEVKEKYAGYSGMSLDHPWGSCQYAGAYAMFKTLHETNGDLSKDEINITITHEDPLTEEVALPMIKSALNDRYEEWSEDEERNQKIENIKSVPEALSFMRSWSWDLWGAADFLATIIFPNLKIETPKADGVGPSLNKIVQSGNNITGIQCYLLSKYGYIKNEEDFGDFDT